MKKINLDQLSVSGTERLSRTQLKNVLGGSSSDKSAVAGITINCPSGMIPCTCSSSSSTFYGCVEVPSDCWRLC